MGHTRSEDGYEARLAAADAAASPGAASHQSDAASSWSSGDRWVHSVDLDGLEDVLPALEPDIKVRHKL